MKVGSPCQARLRVLSCRVSRCRGSSCRALAARCSQRNRRAAGRRALPRDFSKEEHLNDERVDAVVVPADDEARHDHSVVARLAEAAGPPLGGGERRAVDDELLLLDVVPAREGERGARSGARGERAEEAGVTGRTEFKSLCAHVAVVSRPRMKVP